MQKKGKSDLETRDIIYYFIYKHPGLHLREIFRKLNLSEGTIRYHIKYLTKSKLVTKKIEDRYTRFYPVADNIEDVDKTIIHFFRKEATRNIILLLLTYLLRMLKLAGILFRFLSTSRLIRMIL